MPTSLRQDQLVQRQIRDRQTVVLGLMLVPIHLIAL